jgi:DNA ligase (NAD+)
MDAIMSASKEELMAIPGVGEKVAGAVCDYFADLNNREMVHDLLKLGVSIEDTGRAGEREKGETSFFSGKTVVFTGTLSSMTRDQAEDLVTKMGGKVSKNVSRSTDIVVVGENPGSKYQRAITLGIRVMQEPEFLELIGWKNS